MIWHKFHIHTDGPQLGEIHYYEENEMKTLREIIKEAGREQLGLMRLLIHSDFKGYIRDKEVLVTAVLENTAVVHPPDVPRNKVLVNLDILKVPKSSLIWIEKSRNEQRLYRASEQAGSGRFKKKVA